MKKSLFSLAIIVLISLTSCKKNGASNSSASENSDATASGIYNVNVENSVIEWIGSKPTGKHKGTISLASGNFETEEGTITGGNFTIDMKSINVTDLEGEDKEYLEAHLKGIGEKEAEDHFFNVTKYPTSTFKIISLSEANGAYFIKGILNMKGIAKEVNFSSEITISENEISFVSDPFKIDRTLWNVNYASKSIFDNLKDKFINDDIELMIRLKATK